MQLFDAPGTLASEATAQEVGKQVVVAIPAPIVVQRDDEEVVPLQFLQHLLTIRATGERIAQRTTQVTEDGGLEEKLPYPPGLAFEDLFGQIVEDVAVAAGEGFDKARDVLAPSHRERGQLQPRDPAFGALFQGRDVLG